MTLPAPYQKLAGCMWLARIAAKARLHRAGELPAEYAARFGAPDGVDGQFLAFFDLKKEDLLDICEGTDEEVARWFASFPNASRMDEWNDLAANLGRPGFPMADRLQTALATVYRHLQGRGLETVFAALEADEAAVKKDAAQ